jgi:hypothetical protein
MPLQTRSSLPPPRVGRPSGGKASFSKLVSRAHSRCVFSRRQMSSTPCSQKNCSSFSFLAWITQAFQQASREVFLLFVPGRTATLNYEEDNVLENSSGAIFPCWEGWSSGGKRRFKSKLVLLEGSRGDGRSVQAETDCGLKDVEWVFSEQDGTECATDFSSQGRFYRSPAGAAWFSIRLSLPDKFWVDLSVD